MPDRPGLDPLPSPAQDAAQRSAPPPEGPGTGAERTEPLRAPLFHPGRVLVTPAAAELLATGVLDAGEVLARHLAGDWGEVDEDDQAANDHALPAGDRLLSVYGPEEARLWVITEAMPDEDADPRARPVTTLLRPSDY